MQKILITILLLGVFLPSLVFAKPRTYNACDSFDRQGECDGTVTPVCYKGLVPCGRCLPVGGTAGEEECIGGTRTFVPCQICHFLVMGIGVVEFFLLPPDGLLWILGLLFIVLAGAMMVFAQVVQSPAIFSQAKTIILNTLIGLVLALLAWVVVNTIFTFVGVKDRFGLGPTEWAEINCPIDSNAFDTALCD